MQNRSDHIVKSYSEELESISQDIAHMGGLAEGLVRDSLLSVIRFDTELAENVIERDNDIDELQVEIEQRIIQVLARRQPMANDLRMVVSALKFVSNLERVGDLAKNVSKRLLALGQPISGGALSGLERMARVVADQLKRVMDAYGTNDAEEAIRVWRADTEVDEHYNSLFRELLTYMMEDPRTIGACTHLLFIAKNLERIGDHCTNIAEIIHYTETGSSIAGDRPKSDELEA